MRNLFSNNVSASEVLRLVQERDAAILERDRLKEQLSGIAPLQAKIAQLEQEVSIRLKPGTEEFDLASAERLRERMRPVQPHFPISTSGVFSFSQHQQELYALETLGFKRNGFFLEIGVGTGTTYSNTYLLEKYFAWKGILCEPNPTYFDSIRQSRNSILDTRAVYSKSGEKVRFLCVPGIYGGLSTIVDFVHCDRHTRWGEEVEVETVTLEDVLTQYNAPRDIDYISLDTEGSEEKILESLDFNKWNVTLLTIEHNLVPGRAEKFDAILVPFGYKRVHQVIINGDAWYQKQS
jgi:FkbM family methyltransferase